MQQARAKTAFLRVETGALQVRSTNIARPQKQTASAEPDLLVAYTLQFSLPAHLLSWTQLLSQHFRPNPLPAPKGFWQLELPPCPTAVELLPGRGCFYTLQNSSSRNVGCSSCSGKT